MAASFEGDSDDLDFDQDSNDLECGGNLRRPMNAFLIFCKRHRSLVREKYPHLENRGVTKILGELWANLDVQKKESYTQLAKQYKEAYMKANPDFKWYKQPFSPSRTLVTRPTNQKLSKLDLHSAEGPASPSSSSSSSSVLSPCGITPGKLADESQLGGLSSLIATSTTAPTTTTTTAATGPTPPPAQAAAANKSISKPPKKRYLENLENGNFRSQDNDATSSMSAAPLPQTSLPSHATTLSHSATTAAAAATTTDCSALLKLAEMCSKELVRDEPINSSCVKTAAINGRSLGAGNNNRYSPEGFGFPAAASSPSSTSGQPTLVVTTTSVITTSRLSDVSAGSAFNSATPVSTTTPLTPTKNNPKPGSSSPFSKIIATVVEARTELVSSRGRHWPGSPASAVGATPGTGTAGAGGAIATSYPFSSSPAASERRSAGQIATQRPPAEEQPLDLCKEKTITASNQDLIDCIVDGAFGSLGVPVVPTPREPPFSNASRLRLGAGLVSGASSAYADGADDPARMLSLDATGERRFASVPPKKSKGVRREATTSDGATSHNRFVDGEGGGGGEHHMRHYQHHQQPPLNHHEAYDLHRREATSSSSASSSPRKSQRSCKGKRYKALMSEGVLQPAKERKLSSSAASSSRKPSSSDGGGGGDGDPTPSGIAVGSGRTRTPSDSSESAASRKSDRDDGPKAVKTSRSSTPTDEDMDFLCGSSNIDTGAGRQRHYEQLGERDPTRKRFKTGDFDLEEHIAALPNCNVEALDRKKLQQRKQSPSSASHSPSLAASPFRRGPPFAYPEERKREAEPGTAVADNVYDMANLSDGGSDKADSSSSESRGGDDKPVLVGSQKRKARKRSITHLEPTGNSHTLVVQAGVPGNLKLVALAEVAVGEEKKMPSASNQIDSDSPTESA